jgi:hypothetical protein
MMADASGVAGATDGAVLEPPPPPDEAAGDDGDDGDAALPQAATRMIVIPKMPRDERGRCIRPPP